MISRTCESCRYWSDRIAEVRDGTIYALCLGGAVGQAPKRGSYTAAGESCFAHEEGDSVDLGYIRRAG